MPDKHPPGFDLRERAPRVPVRLDHVKHPRHGRFLEEFSVGDIFHHPRGLTIGESFAQDFAGTFHEANPLYRNREVARAYGYEDCPVSPTMVLNVVLSLSVQDISEQAIAHLGTRDVRFFRPVYPGTTLSARSKVVACEAKQGKSFGVVTVRTQGLDSEGEVVIQYDRDVMVPSDPKIARRVEPLVHGAFEENVRLWRPGSPASSGPLGSLTGSHTYFEDFQLGEVFVHSSGRTVTDEHLSWTYRLGNTHPLHFDKLYTQSREGPLRGDPVVYGGLVFAWIAGLASRDTTENAVWDAGYVAGFHTGPVRSGDTLYALSRVVAVRDQDEPFAGTFPVGKAQFQLIGVKNIRGRDALSRYGAALFTKEKDKEKSERIPEKVFEIEHIVLVRKRAGARGETKRAQAQRQPRKEAKCQTASSAKLPRRK